MKTINEYVLELDTRAIYGIPLLEIICGATVKKLNELKSGSFLEAGNISHLLINVTGLGFFVDSAILEKVIADLRDPQILFTRRFGEFNIDKITLYFPIPTKYSLNSAMPILIADADMLAKIRQRYVTKQALLDKYKE